MLDKKNEGFEASSEIPFDPQSWNREAQVLFSRKVFSSSSSPRLIIPFRAKEPLPLDGESLAVRRRATDQMLSALASVLRDRRMPLELEISCGDIGFEGAESLAQILSSPLPIVSFDLTGGRFRRVEPEAQNPLVEGLQWNVSLACLSLDAGAQREGLMKAAAKALSKSCTLLRADFCGSSDDENKLRGRIRKNWDTMRELVEKIQNDVTLSGKDQLAVLERKTSFAFLAQAQPSFFAKDPADWGRFWFEYERKTGDELPLRLRNNVEAFAPSIAAPKKVVSLGAYRKQAGGFSPKSLEPGPFRGGPSGGGPTAA